MTEFNPHLSPEQVDRYLCSINAQTGSPIFYGRNVLRAAKDAGLDVDKLKADGVIAETQRIPVDQKDIWITRP
jgi:hypothetical protein